MIENERGEVLLCGRAYEPDKGKLDLPGGFLEFGEHPEEAIHREIREELGVEIAIEGLLGFVMDRYETDEVATLNIPFRARIVNGTPAPADDVAAIHWLRLADIDRSQLAFRNNETILFELYGKQVGDR